MNYFEIKIACSKSESENIEDHLLGLGACSVTYRDAEDVAILEPAPGEMPLWQDVEVTGMYADDFDQSSILKSLQNKFSNHQIKLSQLQDQVWERTWLEHFKPMHFGNNTWIIPSEYKAVDENAINIYLDPGLAFGTGTHATTALCLDWIDRNHLESKKIIDFGCGSGILAIAALKHKAEVCYCTDIDPQAIESTINNATANDVIGGIKIAEPADFVKLPKLDIVIANILAKPLTTLVETFASLLKSDGEIIMSGILAEQESEIIEAFNDSFIDFQIQNREDWISVYARKKSENTID
jgi:ribosomal protein L11 methyltransferase